MAEPKKSKTILVSVPGMSYAEVLLIGKARKRNCLRWIILPWK